MKQHPKAQRKCLHSDPDKPHFFRPLYRAQTVCCLRTPVPTFWDQWRKEKEEKTR